MSMKKTTVKDFKNQIAQKSIAEAYDADKKKRAEDCMKAFEKIQREFNCVIGCETRTSTHHEPKHIFFAIPK